MVVQSEPQHQDTKTDREKLRELYETIMYKGGTQLQEKYGFLPDFLQSCKQFKGIQEDDTVLSHLVETAKNDLNGDKYYKFISGIEWKELLTTTEFLTDAQKRMKFDDYAEVCPQTNLLLKKSRRGSTFIFSKQGIEHLLLKYTIEFVRDYLALSGPSYLEESNLGILDLAAAGRIYPKITPEQLKFVEKHREELLQQRQCVPNPEPTVHVFVW